MATFWGRQSTICCFLDNKEPFVPGQHASGSLKPRPGLVLVLVLLLVFVLLFCVLYTNCVAFLEGFWGRTLGKALLRACLVRFMLFSPTVGIPPFS